MKNRSILFYVINMFFILQMTIYSQNLIKKEDFEDKSFSDTFHAARSNYWDHLAVTSNDPHSGKFSLRGNASSSFTDSITGLVGNHRTNLNFGYYDNPALGTSFDLDSLHNQELYIKFWLKYDSNFDPNDGYGSNKVWWMQFEDDTRTIYVQFRGSNISFYDEDGWFQCSSVGYSGITECYRRLDVNKVDGKWHKWEIYLKYNKPFSATNGILRVWVDEKLYIDVSNHQIITKQNGKISRIVLGYFHDVLKSSAGWQLDDFEIWDGIPKSENHNKPIIPNNLEIQK